MLAQWDSSGDALWQVKLSVFDGGGTLQGTDTHLIQLDNTAPERRSRSPRALATAANSRSAPLLAGTFVARDLYLGQLQPRRRARSQPAGRRRPSPSSGLVNTAPAPGGDAWTLDTTGMEPCGYIIQVVAVDRAIVNSQSVGHTSLTPPASALR